MNEAPGSAREAVERNAAAVMSGNLTQVMADITPEAMAQMMQMAAQAQAGGVQPPTSMPGIVSYEIEPVAEGQDEATYRVTFVSAMGRATVESLWRVLAGQWKVAGVSLVSAELEPGTAPEQA